MSNSVCSATSKRLPTYTRTMNCITKKTLKGKQEKQSKLIKMIKDVQNETEKKVKELLINEEKDEVKKCPHCLK